MKQLQHYRGLDVCLHGFECEEMDCEVPKCRFIKLVTQNHVNCPGQITSGACKDCDTMTELVREHSKHCELNDCRVPLCQRLRTVKTGQQPQNPHKTPSMIQQAAFFERQQNLWRLLDELADKATEVDQLLQCQVVMPQLHRVWEVLPRLVHRASRSLQFHAPLNFANPVEARCMNFNQGGGFVPGPSRVPAIPSSNNRKRRKQERSNQQLCMQMPNFTQSSANQINFAMHTQFANKNAAPTGRILNEEFPDLKGMTIQDNSAQES
ncbi:Hypothetical predicted protein [Cloeon dipterum]|uniref:TAZ-type domain-containing protein n=1 Tax=Cloeon dipterum TaxID=197152 RepID=A0A8S1DY18_9INSE|nr:Hypothetical predicted protein [Cloeon dipterum]